MSRSGVRDIHGSLRRPALAARDVVAANTFYTGALRGSRVHQTGRLTDGARLWFRVDELLIETGPGLHGGAPVLLHVHDPLAVAERCWDAGFTVRLLDPPFGHAAISVMDPFGRQVNLAPLAGDDARQAAKSV